MIQDDLDKFPQTIWVKIYHNKMQLMQHDGMVLVTHIASLSYAHPRSIIHQTDHAISNLTALLKKASKTQRHFPWLFLQLMDHTEFGLTHLEQDALKNVARHATHAHVVRLYNDIGECIEHEELNTVVPHKQYRSFIFMGLIILLVCVLLALFILYQSNK